MVIDQKSDRLTDQVEKRSKQRRGGARVPVTIRPSTERLERKRGREELLEEALMFDL